MMGSFSARSPPQLDKIIFYSGPPRGQRTATGQRHEVIDAQKPFVAQRSAQSAGTRSSDDEATYEMDSEHDYIPIGSDTLTAGLQHQTHNPLEHVDFDLDVCAPTGLMGVAFCAPNQALRNTATASTPTCSTGPNAVNTCTHAGLDQSEAQIAELIEGWLHGSDHDELPSALQGHSAEPTVTEQPQNVSVNDKAECTSTPIAEPCNRKYPHCDEDVGSLGSILQADAQHHTVSHNLEIHSADGSTSSLTCPVQSVKAVDPDAGSASEDDTPPTKKRRWRSRSCRNPESSFDLTPRPPHKVVDSPTREEQEAPGILEDWSDDGSWAGVVQAELEADVARRQQEEIGYTKAGRYSVADHELQTMKQPLRILSRPRTTQRQKSKPTKHSIAAPDVPATFSKRRGRPPKCTQTASTTLQEKRIARQSSKRPRWAVDCIVEACYENSKLFYKVRWEDTWEPADGLQGCADLAIAEFHGPRI